MSEEYFDKKDMGGDRREGNASQGNRNYQRPRFNRDAKVGSSSNFNRRGFNGDNRNSGHYAPRFHEGGEQGENARQRYSSNRYSGNGEGRPARNYGGGYQSHDGYRSESRWNKRPSYNSNNYGGGRNFSNHNNNNFGGNEEGSRSYRSYNNNGGEQGSNFGGSRNNQGFGSRQQGGNRSFRGGKGYDPHAKYSQKKRLEYKEENYDPNEPVRLNKFLANAGICSRRDADKYIQAGVVTVNGQVVTELGTRVLRSDTVLFHDNAVKMEKKVYVLLNKPKGYVTTVDDPQNRKTVMDLVKNACHERIYPVGRLDRNTTGVLLLTNDGEMASRLTHPKFVKKKIYHVYTDQNVTAADLRQIAEGITLEDGDIKADAVEYASETDKKQVGIEIHSGKNRIVRRIFEHLGYRVVKLDRVYFAGLTKKNVKRGDWRYLTEKEVAMLRMGAFE